MNKKCPDCGVSPGKEHQYGCDVERCARCGGQLIGCDCETEDHLLWTGKWPGIAEAEEFGWYAKLIDGKGWVSCPKTDKGAGPDLNRLYVDAVWDREKKRFVRKWSHGDVGQWIVLFSSKESIWVRFPASLPFCPCSSTG